MKKILVILMMVFLCSTAVMGQNPKSSTKKPKLKNEKAQDNRSVEDLVKDIDDCKYKIWQSFHGRRCQTEETRKANVAAWEKRIHNNFKKVFELLKDGDKEIDHVEHAICPHDTDYYLYECVTMDESFLLDTYKVEDFNIYYADGTISRVNIGKFLFEGRQRLLDRVGRNMDFIFVPGEVFIQY